MNKTKNYIYNMIYRISICVLPLVVTPYITRVLGAENNGLYAFSSCVACYFIMFAKLGIENYGNRTIASCIDGEKARNRLFWSIYSMQLITGMTALVVYALLVVTVFRGNMMLYVIQGLYVLSAVFDVSWFFFGIEDFKYTAYRSVAARILIIIGVFAFVKDINDLNIYTLVMSACFLVEQLLLIPKLISVITWERVGWDEIKVHFIPNVKLFLPLIALSIFNWMDKLMIGIMSDNAEVAYYNYGDSIINLPKGIVTAIGTVMLPRVANMAARGDLSNYKKELKSSSKLVCMICCALGFGIAGVAPVFVPFFLGEGYEPTTNITVLLAAVMVPLCFIDIIQTQYLIPFKKEKDYTMSLVWGAVVNLVLNCIFIPKYASVGAVVGTLGAEITVFVYQLYSAREVYGIKDVLMSISPFIPCGILEFVVVRLIANVSLPVIVILLMQVVVGGIVYLICCIPACFREIKGFLHK